MTKINFKWILLIIYSALLIIFWKYQGPENLIFNLKMYLIAPLTAIISGLLTLKVLGWGGKRSSVFKLTLFALILWFFAETVLLYLAWKGSDTYPSLADLLFILGYILYSLSVIKEAKVFNLNWNQLASKVKSFLALLFIGIVGTSVYIMTKGYDPEAGLLSNIATISWSMGDLSVGSLSIILLALSWNYQGGAVRRIWFWFIAAVALNFIADMIYSLNPSVIVDGSLLNSFLNAMWMGAYFCFAGYFLEMRSILLKLKSNVGKDVNLSTSIT